MTTGRDVWPIRSYYQGDIPEMVRINGGKFMLEPTVVDTKPALKSTTIQGTILTLIGTAGSYLELSGKLPLGGASLILTAAGAVLSMIGRKKADTKIDGIF